MKKVFIILGCLLAINCQNQQADRDRSIGKYGEAEDAVIQEEAEYMEPPRSAEAPSPPEYSLEKGSKIIKNGYMMFEVSNLEIIKSKVDTILKSNKGYYENEQYNSYGNRISYTLILRVPNEKFDSIVYLFESGIGELKSKNISAQDVTEEYVDLNIRLESNLAYLKQYKEILNNAKTIKDILDVQEKIRNIEEEIESKKGRLKYLDNRVSYSTLNLELTELISLELSNKPNVGLRVVNAFKSGIQGFLSFIIFLVSLWPFIILLIILIIGRKPIMNRIKGRNNRKASH